MRVDHRKAELRREQLKSSPFDQFALWFEEACAAKIVEPNAMTLATVGLDGRPSLRTVLLKGLDASGFVFYTNLQSRKAREIAMNANVSLPLSVARLGTTGDD